MPARPGPLQSLPGGAPISETPLTSVPGWIAPHVARMGAAWVTTAEQVVSMAATARGVQSIAEQLDVDVATARALVDSAAAALPESARRDLQRADDTDRGLGSLPPKP